MKRLMPALLFLPLFAGAQPKMDYKKAGAPIPEFTIVKPDGKAITQKALKPGKPAIILIFSPDCDHCGQMLDSMKAVVSGMEQTQLFLVTEARNKDHLKDFIEKKELDKYPAFRETGWDKGNLIYHIYTYQMLPQVNVYDAKHQLTRSFTGAFLLDSLKQYLK